MDEPRFGPLVGAALFALGVYVGMELRPSRSSGQKQLVARGMHRPVLGLAEADTAVSAPEYDRFMAGLQGVAAEPAARRFAEDFAAEPALAASWKRLQQDRDVPRFLTQMEESEEFGRLVARHEPKPGFPAVAQRVQERLPELAPMRRPSSQERLARRRRMRAIEGGAYTRGSDGEPAAFTRAGGTSEGPGGRKLLASAGLPDAAAELPTVETHECGGATPLHKLGRLDGESLSDYRAVRSRLARREGLKSACSAARQSDLCVRSISCCSQDAECARWLLAELKSAR